MTIGRGARWDYSVGDTQWPCTASAYALKRQIGSGSTCIVWHAEARGGREAAIKIVNLEETNSTVQDFAREVKIMCSSHHPNIMPIHCTFISGSSLWIVMPVCFSVKQLILRMYPKRLGEDVIAYIAHGVLSGLRYLHHQGIIHRDIKAENILVSSEGNVFVADFGVSKKMTRESHGQGLFLPSQGSFAGTPCFISPEVIQLQPYGVKADVWSFGVLVMQMAHGHPPHYKMSPVKAMLATLTQDASSSALCDCGNASCNSRKLSVELKRIVERARTRDPLQRATAADLLRSKYWARKKCGPRDVVKLLVKHKLLPSHSKTDRLDTKRRTFAEKERRRGGGALSKRHRRGSRPLINDDTQTTCNKELQQSMTSHALGQPSAKGKLFPCNGWA